MAARKEKKLNSICNDTISHFTHPHPLEISTIQRQPRGPRRYDKCGICSEILDPVSRVYACKGCSFFLHDRCAELKLDIRHPFHHHPLHFHIDPLSIGRTCNVCGCGSSSDSFGWYRCELQATCTFNVHLKCAILKPVDNIAIDEHHVEVLQNSHGHSLFVCNKPNYLRFSCTRCEDQFGDDDMIYICLECKSMFDEPCAAHGTEITHPLHPQHTLSLCHYLVLVVPPFCCSVCGGKVRNRYFFKCSSCTIFLHTDCAKLDVTTKICETSQEQIQIQPVTHPHPLVQVEVMINMKKFKSSCFVCGLQFEDLVYACLTCGILLHKHCADLPNEITSHLHPNHLLKLVENYSRNYDRSPCRVCIESNGQFFYNCRECEFGLDVRCARAALPLIMSEYHEHTLAYVDTRTRDFECAFCTVMCRQYYFSCLHLDCNFNIHDHCYPSLPQSIKHDCHIHPLIFIVHPIKEVTDYLEEETELYCYACEEPRAFDNPTYFCSSCQFVAHIHCVITSIIPYLNKELKDIAVPRIGFEEESETKGNSADEEAVVHQIDRELERLGEEVQAIQLKMGELRKRRDELNAKRKESRRKFMLEIKKRSIEEASLAILYRGGHAFVNKKPPAKTYMLETLESRLDHVLCDII